MSCVSSVMESVKMHTARLNSVGSKVVGVMAGDVRAVRIVKPLEFNCWRTSLSMRWMISVSSVLLTIPSSEIRVKNDIK